MKVLHLNTTKSGGAYRAARRIHEAVSKQGVDSSMLFIYGDTEEESIAWRWQDKIKHKIYCRLNNAELKKYDVKGYFSNDRFGFDITKEPKVREAEILHFHWISDGMFSMKSLGKLMKSGKPIVWTMHDMYAFTGGCHYSEECTRYESRCENCPILNGNNDDISSKLFRRKTEIYPGVRMKPVGCSRWMAECAEKSQLLKAFDTIAIPNPIDTVVFNMIERKTARNLLGLPLDKKLILFGAESAESDRRKGFEELCNVLSKLPENEYMCVVFGNGADISREIGVKTISLGYINDDFHLKCVYNAADVFVCPSLYENLANTVMEALSCGTPVAAFDVGGMADMIIHEGNGYLAECYNTDDLAEGIRFCASNDLRNEARKSAEDRFSYDIVGARYMCLYNII